MLVLSLDFAIDGTLVTFILQVTDTNVYRTCSVNMHHWNKRVYII